MKCQKMRKRENYTDTWCSTGMVSFSISWVWILDIFTSISAVFKTIDDFMHEKMNRKRISLGNYFPTRTHSNVAQYGASFRCVVQLRLNNKSNDTIMRSPKSVKPTNNKTYGVLYICVYVFLFSMWICQKGHLH